MKKKKVISIEDKIPTLKEERKKKANRRLLFYLSIFFILISILVYLQSPLSHVKEIKISGNDLLTDEQVITYSNLTTKDNIWTINRSAIEKKLNDIDVIKTAKVKRKLPWTIEMSIEEHYIVGYVHEEKQYLPILENGTVLIKNEHFQLGDAPILSRFTDEPFLNRMATELGLLPHSILNLISEIIWTPSEKNKYKITLYMNDGFVVEATIRDFASKMKNYPSITAQLNDETKGIIHMSVGSYFEKIE